MKAFSVILLAVSLVVNAWLALALVSGLRSTPPDVAAAQASTTPAAASASARAALDANLWPELHSTDLSTLVARLREAGFPPAMVRAVLQGQLEEEFVGRRRALQPDADSTPFWKNARPDPATEAMFRQLSRDYQKKMKELLGADAQHIDPMMRARENKQLAHLSPEKADQVRQVFREFTDMRNDVYANFAGGMLGTAEREKLAALEKRQNEAIAQLLSPAEFEEFEMRGSNTGNSLRSRLAAFDATEEEFRTMFRLQRQHDLQFSTAELSMGPRSPEESRRRAESQRNVDEQIKAALGPARAAEFERAANYEYARTSQLVARLQLPPETTRQVWDVQQSFQQRTNEIRTNRNLSAEERTSQLQALANEANDKLSPLLGGARGVEAYKQNSGYWLQNIVPSSGAARVSPMPFPL